MKEEQLIDGILSNEHDVAMSVCELLRGYEKNMQAYLADFVASLCNVEKDVIFSDEYGDLDSKQARWFYWYAYRYMTNETYKKIKDSTSTGYTRQGVASSVNRMAEMIESEPIWKKRWLLIKRVIKTINGSAGDEEGKPITIVVPKGVNVELKREQ